MFQRRVVIISGLGATGRLVFDRLEAQCVHAVPVSRTTRPAFDWRDRSTWPAALHGATAAYVTYPPGLGTPGAADAVGSLAGVAAEMGIEHLVLLSLRGKRRALRAERRLRAAPLDHTVLRAEPGAAGRHDGAVADLAAAALCDPLHLNRTYEIDRDGKVLMVGDPARPAESGMVRGSGPRAWREPQRRATRVESAPFHSS